MKQENFKDGMVIRDYDLSGLHKDVRDAIKSAAIGSALRESRGKFIQVTKIESNLRIAGKGLAKSSEGDQN